MNILNCKTTGKLQGEYGIGGIAGVIDNSSTMDVCKNEMDIAIGNGNSFGGIAAIVKENSEIRFCYNIGSIKGNGAGGNIGGTVGRIYNGGKIEYCYNNGIVEVSALDVGGVVGLADTIDKKINITNCYNLANVMGVKSVTNNIGGIIGCGSGTDKAKVIIMNVYNKGNVSNGDQVGGIVGGLSYCTLEGEFLNYGAVADYTSYIGGICGNMVNTDQNYTKRKYGGNCSSSIKVNGNGSNYSDYEANLVMQSVYSVVNALNTGEFVVAGNDENTPKLKDIE